MNSSIAFPVYKTNARKRNRLKQECMLKNLKLAQNDEVWGLTSIKQDLEYWRGGGGGGAKTWREKTQNN